MRLRDLEQKDAPYMLEWMHDGEVTGHMRGNFSEKTMDDAIAFIENSKSNDSINLAIVSDDDEYIDI